MKHKHNLTRRAYTAQFYKKNCAAFLVTVLTTLLIASVNLWISWVIQQMIDSVSGVSGALTLPALALTVSACQKSLFNTLRAVFQTSKV